MCPVTYDLILFDGQCNLCNGWVQFLLKRDHAGRFRFAALQSEFGQKQVLAYGKSSIQLQSVFLITDSGRLYTQSEAALRILMRLGGLWRILVILLWIPATIRDTVYGFIARNRYRWFGKSEVCWLPELRWQERFLS